MGKHIVWVNETAGPKGGCERYIAGTARLLAARGISSTLLYDPVATGASTCAGFDRAFPMVDLRRQLAELEPDVIFAHRVEGAAAVESITAAGAPAVRFFHDHRLFCLREHKYRPLSLATCTQPTGLRCYACPGFVARGPSGLALRTLGALEREQRANRRFDAFVVGSRYMADQVAAHGFDRARIHVLPLFVEAPHGEDEPAREPGQLLFVGQLVRGKGLDVLLAALALMRRPARLWVAGSGRQEEAARARCRALGLEDRVEFLGALGAAELAGRYRRAACLVLPTRQPETFGLVGPEAMLRGTPVVATCAGGVAEWLEHGRTGLAVPAGDPVGSPGTELEFAL